jgi:hypothetical protein
MARGHGPVPDPEREPERVRRAAPMARQAPLVRRRRVPRPRPGWPRTRPGLPTAPRAGTAPWPPVPECPQRPPGRLRVLTVLRPGPTAQRASFRRFRRHPRPGPGRHLGRHRGLPGAPALPVLHGSRGRRGLRLPRRTSGDQGPGRLVPPRLGPPARGLRAVRGRGLLRRGPQDLALPVPVPPGRAGPARPVQAPRVPARGRVTTRSARPRPAWDRRPRRGPRVRFPVSRAAPGSRRAARAVPGRPVARVPRRAGRAGPARTDRALAARVLVVPGPAR